jgi:hypothetical protein
VLIEALSSGYSNGLAVGTFPARIARHTPAAIDGVPEEVRAIAWKTQIRSRQHYRQMMANGRSIGMKITLRETLS